MNTARCLTVTEVHRLLNLCLEQGAGVIEFEGEISEIKTASSGHIYGTIKDAESQIRVTIWSSTARSLKIPLSLGMHVQCRGKPQIYPKTGAFQIILSSITPIGEGLLRKKFLELKEKLEKEGLFAQERKRPLPFLPKAIGIVTSASGAAVHDIMVKLTERMPTLQVYLVDSRVQGPGAAEEIAAGIKLLNKSKLVDIIIIGRGGGSLEDLWAFNEEVLVRAIFASAIPIVSAVGHEVDISLTDYAADVRAPTPTAAGEMVVPHRADLLAAIADLSRRLFDSDRWVGPLQQTLDEVEARLQRSVLNTFAEQKLRLERAEAHLRAIEPNAQITLMYEKISACERKITNVLQNILSRSTQRLSLFEQRLHSQFTNIILQKNGLLETLNGRLHAISPQRVLERGFALVESKGKPIGSVDLLSMNDDIRISFADGKIGAKVTEKV